MRKFFLIFCFSILFSIPFTSQALTVGPGKSEYSADPGDAIEGKFFLLNEEKETKTFYPSFESFIEIDGEKSFLPQETGLATWIKTAKSVKLGPGESEDVPFTIEIPKNAEPGGHFAVTWWGSAPEGGGVAIVTRVGALFLIRVSGQIKEAGKILTFSPQTGKKVFWSLPIIFKVVFMNEGNVHLKPQGEINVKNLLGRSKVLLPVNEVVLQVLPESKRTFETTWKTGKFTFGVYKAELNMAYGEEGKQLSESFWFWVIPLKVILILFFGLVFLVLGLPKMIKKYNQWIIGKAKERLKNGK